MQHCAGFISAESLYMFQAQAPIIRSFKTSTAATGTCIIVVGQSSHLLIRVGTEVPALIRRCDDLPTTIIHVPVAAVLVLKLLMMGACARNM